MLLLLSLIHDTLLLLHLDLFLSFLVLSLVLHLFIIHQTFVFVLLLALFLLTVTAFSITHLECFIRLKVLLLSLMLFRKFLNLLLRFLPVDALNVLDPLLSFLLKLHQTERSLLH